MAKPSSVEQEDQELLDSEVLGPEEESGLVPRWGKTKTTGSPPTPIFPELFNRNLNLDGLDPQEKANAIKLDKRREFQDRMGILQTIKTMQAHLPTGSAEEVYALAPRFFASVTGKHYRFWAAFRAYLNRPVCLQALPMGDIPEDGFVAKVGKLESIHWVQGTEPHWAAVIEGRGALGMEDALVAIARFGNFLADAWDEVYSDQLEGRV